MTNRLDFTLANVIQIGLLLFGIIGGYFTLVNRLNLLEFRADRNDAKNMLQDSSIATCCGFVP